MDGVVRTRVGYAGGTKRGHTEVFQVEFNPNTITYRELLGHVLDSQTTEPN